MRFRAAAADTTYQSVSGGASVSAAGTELADVTFTERSYKDDVNEFGGTSYVFGEASAPT